MKTIRMQNNKNKINYVRGNLFDYVHDYTKQGNRGCSVIVPHVCNNINAFGAGFAGALGERYPIVKENYHLLGSTFLKNNLGYVQFVEVSRDNTYGHKLIFANMIAQNGLISKTNTRPLNYWSLCKSMVNIAYYIKTNFSTDNKVEIHAPKFGSGLAGGDWNFIEKLIEDIWFSYSTFIYIK
jgi:hypothetical protein